MGPGCSCPDQECLRWKAEKEARRCSSVNSVTHSTPTSSSLNVSTVITGLILSFHQHHYCVQSISGTHTRVHSTPAYAHMITDNITALQGTRVTPFHVRRCTQERAHAHAHTRARVPLRRRRCSMGGGLMFHQRGDTLPSPPSPALGCSDASSILLNQLYLPPEGTRITSRSCVMRE